MNSLLILFPAAIIIIIGSSLVKLFGYKIEQAHFLTVCSVTIFLILSGLIGILQIGYYIVLAAAAASLIYLIFTKFDVKKIFTPAVAGYLIGLVIYIIFSRGSLLFDHDDVVHWAYATKVMYFSDIFYKGLQAMFTPTFNYFVTKTALGFSETTLFSGAWIIIWSCFMLPLKDMQWKDWKKVSFFMIAQYCILGFLYGNVSLQIDQTMGYMAGALAAYAAINRKKTAKDYILIAIGLLAISQIKDSFGAVTSMLCALFIITAEIIQNFASLKRKIPAIGAMFLIPVAGYFVSEMTMDKPEGYMPTENIYKLPVFKLIFQSKLTLALLAAAVISLAVFLVFLVKNRSAIKISGRDIIIYKIAGVVCAVFMIGAFYKVSSLYLSTFTFAERVEFTEAWRDFFYHTYSGLMNKYLLGLIAVIFGAAGFYAVRKKMRKAHFAQAGVMFAIVMIYVMFVLIAYSAGFHRSGKYSASVSWERYLSTAMVMLLTYTIMYFFLSPDIFTDEKKHRILFVCLVMAIVIRYMPYPGIVWNSKSEPSRYGPSSFVEKYWEHSEIILGNVKNDETVYIVSYEADEVTEDKSYGYYPNMYIKYATAPILSNWLYCGYNLPTDDEGDYQKYIETLMSYDYLYVQSAGESYYNVMGSFFDENELYSSKALYRIITDGEIFELEKVYADEKKLIN